MINNNIFISTMVALSAGTEAGVIWIRIGHLIFFSRDKDFFSNVIPFHFAPEGDAVDPEEQRGLLKMLVKRLPY